MATDQLSEAERAARVPGIEFVDGTDGTRRAKPTGTGLEVWQLMRIWWACDGDMALVVSGWELERWQIEAALAYYDLFTEEIDWHVAECERWGIWLEENSPVVFTKDGPIRYQRK